MTLTPSPINHTPSSEITAVPITKAWPEVLPVTGWRAPSDCFCWGSQATANLRLTSVQLTSILVASIETRICLT